MGKWDETVNMRDGSSQAEKSESAKRKGEALRRAFEANPQLKALTRNPLLLTIACLIFEQRGELPKRQVDLYEAYIEEWLLHWRKTGKPILDTDVQLGLLEHLAFKFLEVGQQEFTERELLTETRAYLKLPVTDPLASNIVEEILRTSGLLVEEETGRYRFLHLTFQEYLAARILRDIWQLKKDISAYLRYEIRRQEYTSPYYSKWLNAISFMSEMIPDPEALVQQFLDMISLLPWPPKLPRPHGGVKHTQLDMEQGHCFLAEDRPYVELALRIYKNENCWKVLMQTLEDPHPSKRYAAVVAFEYGLSHISPALLSRVVQALLCAFARESDLHVRWRLATFLVKSGKLSCVRIRKALAQELETT